MTEPTPVYNVETDASGGLNVRLGEEHHFALSGDAICVELASVNAVGIRNLDELESHVINTIAGSRSHVVRFINGSLLNYAYNAAGQLIELSAENPVCRLSSANEILFYIH